MALEPTTVVDLGSSKIAAMTVVPAEKGGFRATGFAKVPSAGIQRGTIFDPAAVANRLGEALEILAKGGKGISRRAVISFGSTECVGELKRGLHPIVPSGRKVTRSDVLWAVQHSRTVIPSTNRETLQTLPGYFKIDGKERTLHPIGLEASRLEVATFLVTGDAEQGRTLDMVGELSDLHLELALFGSLAAGFGVLDQEDADKGCAVVDIGAGATHVAVFRDGAPATTVELPFAGQTVTSDISKLLNASTAEAERLKLESGAALASIVGPEESVDVLQMGQNTPRSFQRRVLCEIIESRMREIAIAIGQALAKAEQWDALPKGLVLTGGGSRLAGIDTLFSSASGLPVRVAAPNITGAHSKELSVPEMAALVGTARFALAAAEDDLEPIGGAAGWRDRVRTMWSLNATPV